jgi:acyl-CoA thioesterase FadM
VGQDGRLRVGNVLRYLEALATEASAAAGFDAAWYLQRGTAWVVREMDLLVGALPAVGAELLLATWVADYGRVQALRDYAIWCAESGALVARAHARWAYIDRARGAPTRLQEELIRAFTPFGHGMPTRSLSSRTVNADQPRHSLSVTAREYEADSQLHINNCVYADWLGEGVREAAGTPPSDTGGRVRPRYLRIEYVRPALPGDRLTVETTVNPAGSRGLLATQRVINAGSGETHVRASSCYVSMLRLNGAAR